jgi:hypothetical protein
VGDTSRLCGRKRRRLKGDVERAHMDSLDATNVVSLGSYSRKTLSKCMLVELGSGQDLAKKRVNSPRNAPALTRTLVFVFQEGEFRSSYKNWWHGCNGGTGVKTGVGISSAWTLLLQPDVWLVSKSCSHSSITFKNRPLPRDRIGSFSRFRSDCIRMRFERYGTY